VLEAIAKPKNIFINWIGWDSELPMLYLDFSHLTRAVLNLVANAIAASDPEAMVSIRASWQHNVTGRLMITIEDHGIGLPSDLMKLLNSGAADSLLPSKGSALQVARKLIAGVGGIIAAQHGPANGTIVRISLPVDSYGSVIRGWILQNATVASQADQYRVSLFAVRCGNAEAELFNWHLQNSATSKQFVYRVAENRWLVLELKSSKEGTDSVLMAAAERNVPTRVQESQPWLSQSVFSSKPFALDGLLGRTDSDLRLPQLTEQLVEKFEELLGSQPAMGRLTISEPHEKAESFQSGTSGVAPTIRAPHFIRPQTVPASVSTPENQATGQNTLEPGAQTVHEIVKQWKAVQARMAQAGRI
jgi:hypothetical protein